MRAAFRFTGQTNVLDVSACSVGEYGAEHSCKQACVWGIFECLGDNAGEEKSEHLCDKNCHIKNYHHGWNLSFSVESFH